MGHERSQSAAYFFFRPCSTLYCLIVTSTAAELNRKGEVSVQPPNWGRVLTLLRIGVISTATALALGEIKVKSRYWGLDLNLFCTGVISTAAALDREARSEYSLLIEAKDLGTPVQQATRYRISVCFNGNYFRGRFLWKLLKETVQCIDSIGNKETSLGVFCFKPSCGIPSTVQHVISPDKLV
jgi:hypothetical protein